MKNLKEIKNLIELTTILTYQLERCHSEIKANICSAESKSVDLLLEISEASLICMETISSIANLMSNNWIRPYE